MMQKSGAGQVATSRAPTEPMCSSPTAPTTVIRADASRRAASTAAQAKVASGPFASTEPRP